MGFVTVLMLLLLLLLLGVMSWVRKLRIGGIVRYLKKEFTDIRPEEISFENGSRKGVKEREVDDDLDDDLALFWVDKRKEEEGRTWKADTTIDWIKMMKMKTTFFMRLGTLRVLSAYLVGY